MTRSRLGTSRLNTKSFVLIVLRRSVAVVSLLTVVAVTAMAQNPVPFIDQPLVPDAAAPGSAGFTLTVNGAGFLTTSVVNWNGSPRATSFVRGSRLTATILATDIATASTAAVTVVNPSPGGGTSVPQFFSISVPVGSVSFLPAVAYAAGAGCANSVAVADVDGDGKPDLVVALGCRLGSTGLVTVMLGNGDGTFQAAVTYSSGGANASSVAVADVNGDGKPDLVLANGCTYGADCPLGGVVGVLLGNGDGTFQAALTFNSGGDGSSGSYLAIADVNGDGKSDLVVASFNDGTTSVLLGNGDGTFRLAVTYDTGGPPYSVAIADVNGDGKLDLVIANWGSDESNGDGSVGVLLGNGDGTFQPVVAYDSGGQGAHGAAVADVNGDGKPDIVVANFWNSSVGVLLGNNDGTFNAAVTYGSGGDYATMVAIGDVNSDGRPDVAVANCAKPYANGCPYKTIDVGVLLGNGNGAFQSAIGFDSEAYSPQSIVVADVNGDGKPDIVVATACGSNCSGGGAVGVLINNAVGPTATSTALTSSPDPSFVGQAVTLTATVSSNIGAPPNGETVTFKQGSTALGTGTLTSGLATFRTASLKVSSDFITAVYGGDPVFVGSTSKILRQVVNEATTTTRLVSSQNPSSSEQSVTFTATVAPQFSGTPAGPVSFYNGVARLGTATLSGGVASYTTTKLTVGAASVTAVYHGSSSFTPSTSAALSQLVNQASTTTTLTSSRNPSNSGQSVTFTAAVAGRFGGTVTGSVTFMDGSTTLATVNLSGSKAKYTTSSLAVGSHDITATYRGSTDFTGSSASLTQNVN